MKPEIKVGSTVWMWERGEWKQKTVTGENRASWIVGKGWDQVRIAKKDISCTRKDKRGNFAVVFWSPEEIEQYEWVRRNDLPIGNAVQYSSDYATLRKIADLIGYKERT